MNVIIFLMFAVLANSVPCKKRDSEASGRRNEGFYYYYKTTIVTTEGSTYSRNIVSVKTITPRGKICAPYEFNGTICEYVGDRELCGYNKNPERVESKINSRFLSNGCWLRKGRVECGYREPYAANVRRPPISYPPVVREVDTPNTVYMLKGQPKTTRFTTTSTTTKPTTVEKECTEIHSRIVCRPKRT